MLEWRVPENAESSVDALCPVPLSHIRNTSDRNSLLDGQYEYSL
jgi:hypothetical protein